MCRECCCIWCSWCEVGRLLPLSLSGPRAPLAPAVPPLRPSEGPAPPLARLEPPSDAAPATGAGCRAGCVNPQLPSRAPLLPAAAAGSAPPPPSAALSAAADRRVTAAGSKLESEWRIFFSMPSSGSCRSAAECEKGHPARHVPVSCGSQRKTQTGATCYGDPMNGSRPRRWAARSLCMQAALARQRPFLLPPGKLLGSHLTPTGPP